MELPGFPGPDGPVAFPDAFNEIIGVFGVAVYLAAYFALQVGWIRGRGYAYPALNLVAASMVLASLATQFNLAAALIQVSFISISLFGLVRTWLSDVMLRLSEEEHRLIDSKFADLRGRSARTLVKAGYWTDLPAGTVLTAEGRPARELTYLASGAVEVRSCGQALYRYGADLIVGEVSCLSGAPSTATTVVIEPARVFRIDCGRLRRLTARDDELRLGVEAGFARDIRQKIVERNAALLTLIRTGGAGIAAETGTRLRQVGT